MTPKALLAPARLAGRPVLRSQSDERLVDLVRAGSEPAFEAIVARYRGQLLRYCRRTLPEARAEDAVQQAFLSAFRAMRRDDAYIDLRPWLYRIAHNTTLNVLRDRGLRHGQLDERIDGVERPDQAMERRQGLRDVLAAVKALPERQRDAMVLRELEGRSYEQIAGELGVTRGAVRQLLNRARTTLRAGVSALTPLPLMLWLSSGEGEPTAARMGELVGAGGAGAIVTKVAATALVTGAVAGGIATVPDRHHLGGKLNQPPAATASEARHAADDRAAGVAGRHGAARTSQAADDHHGRDQGEQRRGRHEGGHGDEGGRRGDDGGHSGPGGGDTSGDDRERSGSSGPGSEDSGGGEPVESAHETPEKESSGSGPGSPGDRGGDSGLGHDGVLTTESGGAEPPETD
jgi:RNA polymerase sigma factor (sigma-70 family)